MHVSRQQPLMLAGGWASRIYVDACIILGGQGFRQVVTNLVVLYLVVLYIDCHCFGERFFDAVAGAQTTGIPLLTWFADWMGLKFRYIR